MELFYDLLGMTPFSESFIDHLIINNCNDLYKYYFYIFRYNLLNQKLFPLTNEISYFKLISTFFFQTKTNLNEIFNLFDNLINCLINFLDSSPTDQLLNRSIRSLSSSTLLLIPNFQYNSIELIINYENLFHFNLKVFDCDSIDQIKTKLISQLNSYEKLSLNQIDLSLPLKTNSLLYSYQIPIIKHYHINSTILCRKKTSWNYFHEKNISSYHLSQENQLINDENFIRKQLKENKRIFNEILKDFYENIQKGLKGFRIDQKQNSNIYIQIISQLIRRLNLLIISRSNCPIIQSSLNTIADGLEFIFQTKTQVKY